MSTSNRAVAEAFSSHRFSQAYDRLATDVVWVNHGGPTLEGKAAVVAACESTLAELRSTTTEFTRFVVVADDAGAVVDVTARYTRPDGDAALVSSCDVYEITDGQVVRITSYAVVEDAVGEDASDVVAATDPALPTFDTVVLDCPDPAALAGFYARLLGWPMPEVGEDAEQEGGAVTLDAPGGGAAIGFHRASGFVSPTWPEPPVQQQAHIDFFVGDIEAAHERAVGLGARHLRSHEHRPGAGYRVYADPVGHPFCLCWW